MTIEHLPEWPKRIAQIALVLIFLLGLAAVGHVKGLI